MEFVRKRVTAEELALIGTAISAMLGNREFRIVNIRETSPSWTLLGRQDQLNNH